MIKRKKPIKRVRIKKTSEREVPKLKKKLRDLLHRAIRARDGNQCFSCYRADLEGSGWHAGHMFSAGSNSSLKFHPDNIHSQCYNCNINQGGNGASHALEFINRHGRLKLDALAAERRITKRWFSWELEELIEAIQKGLPKYTKLYYEKHGPDLSAVPEK